MFKAFRDWRERKEIERAFQASLGRIPDDVELKIDYVEREIGVAFISFPAPDASAYSGRCAIISDIAEQYEGHLNSMVPILVVTFGMFNSVPSEALLRFVKDVQSRLPAMTSIVHGTIGATVGAFGSAKFQAYGFWWPRALGALRQLTALAPGESAELNVEVNA
jgi:hypothetical protein